MKPQWDRPEKPLSSELRKEAEAVNVYLQVFDTEAAIGTLEKTKIFQRLSVRNVRR